MALPEYQRPAQYRRDLDAWITSISVFLTGVLRGRLNINGEVTLAYTLDEESDAGQTIVRDDRCHSKSVIHFDPLTIEAATALYGGDLLVTEAGRTEGQFIITHPVYTDGANRAYRYTIVG